MKQVCTQKRLNDMKITLKKYLSFFCLVGIVFACTDVEQLELGEFSAEFAIPLFSSDLSLQDIISNRVDNTTLSVSEEGQLTLNYTGNLLTQTAADVFEFTAALVPIEVTDSVFHIQNEDFDILGTIEIDFLNLKQGQLNLQYQYNEPQDLTLEVTIPQFVKDGEHYNQTISTAYTGDLPVTGSLLGVNLEGYQIQGGDTLITILYNARLEDGTEIILPSFLMLLTNLEYSYAEGFLGNDIYNIGKDTIVIDIFDNWEQGIVNFEDPKINLTIFNSFGFPVDANFIDLDVIGIEGERLSLQSLAIDDGVKVFHPSLDQIGETIVTNFSFTKENSNLTDILAVGPASVEYELNGEPNPEVGSEVRGFMTDSSSINIQMDVELPLNGYTFGFALRDTFDIDLSEYENVQSAEFKLITENEIPLGLDLEVTFVDENFNVVDILNTQEDNNYIEAAPVNSDGIVNGAAEKTILDSFDADRFSNIKSANKIIVRTSFNTTNYTIPQLVQFNANQSIKSRMGLKVEIAN